MKHDEQTIQAAKDYAEYRDRPNAVKTDFLAGAEYFASRGWIPVGSSSHQDEEIRLDQLHIGEIIETEEGKDGKRNLLIRIGDELYIDLNNLWAGEAILLVENAATIKGRKVKVEMRIAPQP